MKKIILISLFVTGLSFVSLAQNAPAAATSKPVSEVAPATSITSGGQTISKSDNSSEEVKSCCESKKGKSAKSGKSCCSAMDKTTGCKDKKVEESTK